MRRSRLLQQQVPLPGGGFKASCFTLYDTGPWSIGTTASTLCPLGRATLTSLPQEVLGRIVKYLHGNDKVRCLPVFSKGSTIGGLSSLRMGASGLHWCADSPGVVLQGHPAHPVHGQCEGQDR